MRCAHALRDIGRRIGSSNAPRSPTTSVALQGVLIGVLIALMLKLRPRGLLGEDLRAARAAR